MSHETEILHRGAAFRAACGRPVRLALGELHSKVVAASGAEAELASLGATTVRTEEPVCGSDGEEDRGEPRWKNDDPLTAGWHKPGVAGDEKHRNVESERRPRIVVPAVRRFISLISRTAATEYEDSPRLGVELKCLVST